MLKGILLSSNLILIIVHIFKSTQNELKQTFINFNVKFFFFFFFKEDKLVHFVDECQKTAQFIKGIRI